MRILTVVYDLDKGGTQRAAQNFCEAYKILGHDSQLLAVNEGGPREKELKSLNIPVYVRFTPEFFQHIEGWEPDIVHLHSHALKKQEIYSLKELWQNARFIETNVFSCLSDYSEDILEYSFQLSEWCKYLYITRGGSREKGVIIPNPIKTDRFKRASLGECNAFRKQYNIPEDAFLLGRVGQKHFAKWSHYLLDIFQKFIENVNKNSYLVLVNVHDAIITYAKEKKLMDRIILIEVILGDEELCQFYSAIDLFVHISSQGESFGYALAESLLCETPVIAYNTPWSDNSQAEIVGNGIGGYCVNSRNEFFDCLQMLFNDEKLRKKLGVQGRKKIINDYEYIYVAQKGLDIMTQSYRGNSNLIISSFLTTQNLSILKRTIVKALMWAKLQSSAVHRISNYLLKKLFKHKIHYY